MASVLADTSSNGYFPTILVSGWLFNLVFVHLGSLGIYMLMMDFWQMKLYNPILYIVGRMLVIELGVVSIAGVCINYLTGNFVLVNTINLWLSVFPFSFIICLPLAMLAGVSLQHSGISPTDCCCSLLLPFMWCSVRHY